MVTTRASDDTEVVRLEALDPSADLFVVELLVAVKEPRESGVVNVDGGVRVGNVDVKLDDDGEVDAVGLGLVSVPTQLLVVETVGVGRDEALGTVVVFLVEDGAAAMEGGGVDGDEKWAREVGDAREDATVQRVLQTRNRSEHGERAEDLRDVAVFLSEVVKRASKLGEVWDGGAVVAAHAEEAGGLLLATRDGRGRHVEDSAGATRVGANTIAANLVAEPGESSEP